MLIGITIFLWIFLIIAAAVTKQTIPELLSGLMEVIRGTKDGVVERSEDLVYYD